MTVGAVVFNLGGADTPVFPLTDGSGLAPLSLPEEFLRRNEFSLQQPSSDAVLRFETAMGEEPLASHLAGIKNLVAAGTVPIASMGTDPLPKGTDPVLQSGIIAENSETKPTFARDPVSFENPALEAKVVVPRGTVPVQVEGTDPMPKGTDPKQVVGTDPIMKPVVVKESEGPGREVPVATKVPVAPNRESYIAPVVASVKDSPVVPAPEVAAGTVAQTAGTDPVPQAQVVGTDPMSQSGIAAENSAKKPALAKNPVSFENPVVEAKVVVPQGTDPVKGTDPMTASAIVKEGEVLGREGPVAPEVPVAPNRESYVAPVVASVKDVPVAPTLEVEVGTVAEKVLISELEPASRTVFTTEAKLSPETTKPAPEATRLAHKTLVQVPETAKPIIEVAAPILATAKPTAYAKPEINLGSAPAIDKAEPDDEMVAPDAKQAQPLQAMPVLVAADSAGTVDAQSATAREVSAVSAATARTEAVVEVVDKLIEAVVSQISATPSLVQGEGEVHITLKANVLDGSNIALSSKGGELAVVVTPATPEAAQAIAAAAPRLEVALAEHVPTFRNVVVKLGSVSRKGNSDETA